MKENNLENRPKKLFISADMEGIAGIAKWEETEPGGHLYDRFAGQMTREVRAVIEGAEEAGYLSTVKDAHSSAANLRPDELPESARLIRGWERDLWCMMDGLNQEHYDAVAFTGYHSPSMSGGTPLSHTMEPTFQRVTLNGRLASEFDINAYMAGYLGIPVVFLSGDEAMCAAAKSVLPGIETVASVTGLGSAVMTRHPAVVCREMRAAITRALTKEDLGSCRVKMPPSFRIEVEYQDWTLAHRNSFYPGAETVNPKTIAYTAADYYDVMRFMHFCL